MLDAIKKRFFSEAKEVEMKQNEVQTAELSAVEITAQLAAAQEALASQASAFQAVQEQLAELSAKYESAQAALAAVEEAKAALEAEAKEKQMSARKERVEMAIGTEKAPAMLSATEQLDDAQFDAIISAMAASFESESKSTMFKEVGVAAEATPVETDQVQRLAASLAKQFNKSN